MIAADRVGQVLVDVVGQVLPRAGQDDGCGLRSTAADRSVGGGASAMAAAAVTDNPVASTERTAQLHE